MPGWGAKTPQASWPKNQNIKQKQGCDKFNKDFKKTDPHKKKQNKTRKFSRAYLANNLKIPFMERFPVFYFTWIRIPRG